jgi:uncharacterized protein YndB with AHSA1/START domain
MAAKGSGKLKVTLPSDTEILLSREFDAPAHLVYEASTKPDYVKRWWPAMPDYTMPICEIDLRVGGKWRYVMVGKDGKDVAFNGVYREIVPNQRIVHTEIFEPFPQAETVVTVTFEARGDKTLLTALQKCGSKQTRDAIIESGMEVGAGLSYDALEQVAQSLRPAGAAADTRRSESRAD